MDNFMKDLEEICTTLARSLNQSNEKIRSAGGKVSGADLEYIDRLTHSLKSIKAIMKMEMESEMMDDGGYSERGYSRGYDRGGSYRGSYNDGYSMARGRMNARRDSMGRYSRGEDGYSRGGDMMDDLRELMNMAPDQETRQKMQRYIQNMEQR